MAMVFKPDPDPSLCKILFRPENTKTCKEIDLFWVMGLILLVQRKISHPHSDLSRVSLNPTLYAWLLYLGTAGYNPIWMVPTLDDEKD